MNKLVFILLFFTSVLGFSQDKEEVKAQFLDYSQLIINQDFDKAITKYAPEGMLKMVDKQSLMTMMDQLVNNPDFELKLFSPTAIKVDQKKKVKGKNYMNVNYNQAIHMKFKEDVDSNILLGALAMEFGDENVKHNEQTGFFEINAKKDCIAISENKKDWKFAVVEKASAIILKSFVPEQILENYQIK